MSDRPDHDLEPGESDRGLESGEERQLTDWLDAATPVPAAGFRGALGRYIGRRDPGFGPRPPQLRLISAAYVGGGAVLLALGALQATGSL
jgi:hypothetical protein